MNVTIQNTGDTKIGDIVEGDKIMNQAAQMAAQAREAKEKQDDSTLEKIIAEAFQLGLPAVIAFVKSLL